MLEAEKAAEEFAKSEIAYLSRCLLNFQFSGSRVGRIKDFRLLSQDEDRAAWKISVENTDGDFRGYEAEFAVDTRLGAIKYIQIETPHYTLRIGD